ncbi:3'(2'),5'-bisphosphate nucleotidase CysQ [Novosphingobium sp. FSY-8]|uniref:3'(2'),5'-bisphosphate nucleotidase CysQ n=1 Tax=Novosphingobium ovatum TaxID=1908523 RepID=A0ABW9XEH2_9SPHN|nr:3'(2'),5'-bisphosphate nucleotidase CysQ [Novosphingobium ovatum]NBC36926.1 3'(2'),5'-bisphosphate nucleotidase CysQ [Novosphingobium ovatum]
MIDRAHLENIIRNAGKMAMAFWPGQGNHLNHWEKAPNNPVSEADMAVDAYLKDALGNLLPSAGWLSEETGDSLARREGSLIWLVDPIDGTRDFIAGLGGWAVSVALISAGRPLIGALYAPARMVDQGGEFWWAEAARGATRNGTPLRASRRTDLPGARVPTTVLPPDLRVPLTMVDKPNSIALRMAMIAADEADIVASTRWGYEWDIAAAALILHEAGGRVTDAHGEKLSFNKMNPRDYGVLATAPDIHADALAFLQNPVGGPG